MLNTLRSRFLRYWTYFRRGHSMYLVFIITFMNFVVIQFRLLVEYIPLLSTLFTQIIYFAVVFFFIYGPLAIIIGWQDFKRVAVPMDATLSAKASPYNRDIAQALIFISQGRRGEATDILEKWTKKIGS